MTLKLETFLVIVGWCHIRSVAQWEIVPVTRITAKKLA